MSNDIKIFENMPVNAGFTTRECQGFQRSEELVAQAISSSGVVVRLGLVHKNHVVTVFNQNIAMSCNGILDYDNTDGAASDVPGVILTTRHADCLPIYLYD